MERLKQLLDNAIASEDKTGLLLSGGLDSTIIAALLKKKGIAFTAYTAYVEGSNASDVEFARLAAKEIGFELKEVAVPFASVERKTEHIVSLLGHNPVKVGIALALHAAAESAAKDGCKVLFTGDGADELFAGYAKHRVKDVNKACFDSLISLYKVNRHIADVIEEDVGVEMKAPFLDASIVDYALELPASEKLGKDENKLILRKLASELGVPKEISERKKKAAQYGSGFDKVLDKLAKKQGLKKSEYLNTFEYRPKRLGILFSGGKDSVLAMQVMDERGYDVECLISIQSVNPDSYMFHTPNIHMTELQADALALPLVMGQTKGEKEVELKDLEGVITRAKKEFHLDGIVTGALYSKYQSERIQKICSKLGLRCYSPLWHVSQAFEMRWVAQELEAVIGAIAALGLKKELLGKRIDGGLIDRLLALHKKYGINVAGEGGEFESLVLDGPMFRKRIVIEDYELKMSDENTGRMLVKRAVMVNKK